MKLTDLKSAFPSMPQNSFIFVLKIILLLSLYEIIKTVIDFELLNVGVMNLIKARNMTSIHYAKQESQSKPLKVPFVNVCENGTSHLINEIRYHQTLATSNWTFTYPILWDRWHMMADHFHPVVNDLKYHFRPFTYLADNEFKHWLEMKDRKSSCNMITIGVGEVWDGEKVIQKMYPQCNLLGIDPGATINKQLVESLPNIRFIHAAVSDKETTNLTISEKDNGTYAYHQGNVVNFIELLEHANKGKLVDFLSLDAEGAEFALLPLLHRKRDKLPTICQFNVELHFKQTYYGHELKEFMEVLHGFMAEAHYALMNIDIYDKLERNIMMRRMFFVNVVDEECVSKFLC